MVGNIRQLEQDGKVHVVVILKVNSKVRKPLPLVIGVAAEIETCLSYWLLIGPELGNAIPVPAQGPGERFHLIPHDTG